MNLDRNQVRRLLSKTMRNRFQIISFFVGVTSVLANALNIQLPAAVTYSREHSSNALVIWRNNQILHSDYANGFSADTPSQVYSITKSIAALAWLADPKFSSSSRFPRWAGDSMRNKITAGNLLSQTSGISPGYAKIYVGKPRDLRHAATSLPLMQAPGISFAYGPSHYEILGAWAGLRAGGRDAAKSLVKKNILNRLGIHPTAWRTDQRGNIYLSAGAVLSANDLLKLGRLVLDGGKIFGFLPVIPTRNLREALTGSDANPAYGFGFWLNSRSSLPGAKERDVEQAISAKLTRMDWQHTCLSLAAPSDLICMAGSGGQRVYIVPSLRMVVVRLGQPGGFRDPDFLRALFKGWGRGPVLHAAGFDG